ncbi:hypothetical protein VIGAN_01350700, partial [Vigna angularis var. angularis]
LQTSFMADTCDAAFLKDNNFGLVLLLSEIPVLAWVLFKTSSAIGSLHFYKNCFFTLPFKNRNSFNLYTIQHVMFSSTLVNVVALLLFIILLVN